MFNVEEWSSPFFPSTVTVVVFCLLSISSTLQIRDRRLSRDVTPLTNEIFLTCNILFLPHEFQTIQKFKWNCASTSHMALWRFALALFTCTLEMEHFGMDDRGEWKVSEKKLQYIDYVRLVDYLSRVWKHRSTHVILCQCYSCSLMFQQHPRMEFTVVWIARNKQYWWFLIL